MLNNEHTAGSGRQQHFFIDVSHTFSCPVNTGVQRVVRRLAASVRHREDCSFIRFDSLVQTFVKLSADEIDFLIDGWKNPNPSQHPPVAQGGFLGLLKRVLRVVGLFPILAKLKVSVSVRLLRPLKRELLEFLGKPQGIDLAGGTYLTAEVFGEGDRVRALKHWFRSDQVEVVLFVHDLIPFSHPEWSIMKRRDFNRYLSLLGYAGTIATASDHTLQEVLRWSKINKKPLGRIQRIYSGFDLSEPENVIPVRLQGIEPFFACIGTIEPRKNQIHVLASLKHLWDSGKKFTFVFAGSEAEGYGEFRCLWSEMVSAGYPVLWLCPASDQEVQWLYGHALATVYASMYEGYGLPIVESVAHGTPCIASSLTSTGEVAKEFGGCLVIDPSNVKEIGAALSRFLESPSLRAELVAEIRRERLRSWQQFSEELLAWARGDR